MRNTDVALLFAGLAMAAFPATGQSSPPYAGSEAYAVCHDNIAKAFANSQHYL